MMGASVLRQDDVLCPICGDSQPHLDLVSGKQGADTTVGFSRALGGPTLSHAFEAVVRERGSQIRLTSIGDGEHSALLRFAFHKGATYWSWEEYPVRDGDLEYRFISALWRD